MKRILSTILLVLFAWQASAGVTVTNLVIAQRPGTKLMDITYDVSSTTTNAVAISLTVSNGTMTVTATHLAGDIGTGVSTGTGKSIVWNMGTDWNTNAATLNFSVWADDGAPGCPVAKTGQTTSYRTGDDGDLEPGVARPNPRFTNLSDGTVADNLTGLEWAQAPHTLSGNSGATNWNAAVDFCNNLVYAGHSDWRLPSRKELMSLVDYGRYFPTLTTGYPFTGVQTYGYWSGTSSASNTGFAWYVDMYYGSVESLGKAAHAYFVWPVRGEQ
ncbi:MAG: DUF1566 domain-containing protein [Kiritimatiellales bacterium]